MLMLSLTLQDIQEGRNSYGNAVPVRLNDARWRKINTRQWSDNIEKIKISCVACVRNKMMTG